jgi:hypothetical protein
MSPATEVQLLLLSVEEPDAAGNFKVRWNSEVPLCWRDQPFKPQTFKIGRPREADLFSVVESVAGGPPHLQLSPAYAPSTLQYKWHSPCKLALTIQASGVEADSNKLRVEVAWDGKWSNDPKAMRHHLTIIAATSDEGPDRALKPQLQA